jgi:hypothetical protein
MVPRVETLGVIIALTEIRNTGEDAYDTLCVALSRRLACAVE